jgi:hypothetical protein
MTAWARYLIQGMTAVILVGLVAAFSQGPIFAPIPPDHGELKISLSHLAERLQACRQLTEEERMALPPTRRVSEICERERTSTHLQIRLDEQILINQQIRPSGLHGSGRAYFQEFVVLPAGSHQLEVLLKDGHGPDGLMLEQQFNLHLDPGASALLAIGDGEIRLHQPGPSAKEHSS